MKDIALFDGVERLYYEPYAFRGIIHSEMALVLGFCKKLDIEVVIESGRAQAQSTYLLCKYLPNTEIYSIDNGVAPEIDFGIKRVEKFDNITLIHEGASTAVPSTLKKMRGKRIALLLDGPKGKLALLHMEDSLPKIEVGFAHDFRKISKNGIPMDCRIQAEEKFPNVWFTDDPEYVEATAWLDRTCWTIDETPKVYSPYHLKGHFTGSYGPTLAVFT